MTEDTKAESQTQPTRFKRTSIDDVLSAVATFRYEWELTARPNDLAPNYPFEDISELIRSTETLAGLRGDRLISETKRIIENIELPEIDDPSIDVENLRLHWRVSKFQELMFEIIYMSTDESKISMTDEELGQNEIRILSEKIDRISSEIMEIKKGKAFGGVSISVLGVSTPLDTIWKAVQRARSALERSHIDTKAVQENLEDAYSESKNIWQKLNQSASKVADSVLESFKALLIDVGSALQQALGMSRRSKQEKLSTVTLKLNQKISIDEMIEIRNSYGALNKSEISTRSVYGTIDKYVSSFMYGIDIDDDRKRIVISSVVDAEAGVFYVSPVYSDPEHEQSGTDVLMRKDVYFGRIGRFFDYIISRLSEKDTMTVRMTAFEPVISVEPAGPMNYIDEPIGI